MGRYQYKKYRHYNYNAQHQAALQHIEARNRLSRVFGGIDIDIEKAFFLLPQSQLNNLLLEYRLKFGELAYEYAIKTYPSWYSGKTKMSGQTAERLLNLVPPYLNTDTRFDLIKKLRNHCFDRTYQKIITTPLKWQDDLSKPINMLINKSLLFSLPEKVLSTASWLANGSSKAAMEILTAIEKEEATTRLKYLDQEFHRIECLLADIKHKYLISHQIDLPQGCIEVVIKQPRKSLIQILKRWLP